MILKHTSLSLSSFQIREFWPIKSVDYFWENLFDLREKKGDEDSNGSLSFVFLGSVDQLIYP